MKIVKPAKIPVLTRILELAGRLQLHVTGVIAFPLDAPRAICDELTFWKTTSAALGEKGVFDEGFSRPCGELLVCGSFFAPDGKALPASYVRARLGSIDKRLAVIGDRTWQNGVPSAPQPMATMPVDWAHAFGGASFDRNPHGIGVEPREPHPLPNIERYGAVMRARSERPEPAGFLPMDVTFAQRRARAGSFDKRWLEAHFPGMPADTHPNFFNVAPDDQWIEGFFQGDEDFLVENMHPEKPRIEGRLPGLTLRTFVTQRARDGERFVEIPLRCDAVWLFPTAGIGAVVFHGSTRITEDDGADILHLVAACEEPGAPRSIDHYEATLKRRLDKDKGALAGISDGDLMPARSSGVIANLDEGDLGAWTRSERLLAKNLRRGEVRTHARLRARLEAEGLDPDKHGAGPLAAEEEAPPGLADLDSLAAYTEAQMLRADALGQQLATQSAELEEKARATYSARGQDYDEVMAKAARDSAGPPKFSALDQLARMTQLAQRGSEEGLPQIALKERAADPAYRAELEEQQRGMMDTYRHFAHYQPAAAAAMDADDSHRIRTLVLTAIEVGESLANRDFTGVDLSGMALIGIDLAGALLESADLSGCDLSRANLEGAVLARANLRGANLHSAQLRGANLGGAILEDAVLERVGLEGGVLTGARLSGARFTDADLADVQWSDVVLRGVDLSGAVLARSMFIKADLRGVRFIGADLSSATLVECPLDGADFSRSTLEKATFVGCTGEGVSFREARFRQGVIVHGSSFPRADFRDADLTKANLRGTALPGARFDRTTLDGADLSACDATGACFDRASIKGGMMIRTNLDGASLQGTNLVDVLASKSRLSGADFTGANLHRADLSRVLGDAATTFAEAEVGHVRFLPKADVPPRGEP
jgi:uncharacterized protein YjbI with pentapeptide repeats